MRKICTIVTILILLICFVIVDERYNDKIRFSIPSGYYGEEFELKIYGGACGNIYYTLDGSIPTTEDYLYTKSDTILIGDASNNENIYSARTDTSTGFCEDILESMNMAGPGYTVPDYNVDKINVVKASLFDESGNCLDSIEALYLVGLQEKEGYDDIYIASIITEPDNLFGYESGIYNTGKDFDAYVASDFNNWEWTASSYWWWDANYRNTGIRSEREAKVTIYDEERNLILSEDCGIRIQGGGSRGFLPKSIGCFARKEYSGSNEFSADLFEEKMFPHKFVFFSGGDDNQFKLKDYLVNSLGKDINCSVMSFIPAAMFLNGEYWGVYYMTENYNADYVSDHYLVEEDNVVIIKNGEMTEGDEGDLHTYEEVMNYITNNNMQDEENYEKVCKLIDIDSYVDYYALMIYIDRYNDWPGGNWAAWKTREDEGTQYGDGRWRWMLFDVNSGSISSSRVERDSLSDLLQRDNTFFSLYLNQEFRAKLAKRLCYMGKNIYSEDKVNDLIDDYVAIMKEPLMKSNRRFYNDTKEEAFASYVNEVRSFFSERYDYVWNSIVANMGEGWLEKYGIQK